MDGIADRGGDDDVDRLFQPGWLFSVAGTGWKTPAIDAAEAVASGEQGGNVEAARVDDRAFDVGDRHQPDTGPIEVSGGGSPNVAEALQRERGAAQGEADHIGGFSCALSDAITSHQLGDRDAFAAQSERLLDSGESGAALALEAGLQGMGETDQLAGGDDLVLMGAQIGAGGVALGDERPDRVDEAAQDGRRLRRSGIEIDPGFCTAVWDVEHRHFVGHGSCQRGHLIRRDPWPHPDPARTHAADQAVDDKPTTGRRGHVVPLGDEVRRLRMPRQ